jgi:hypothetical protein
MSSTRFSGRKIAERMVRMKTNFSSAHYWAVAKGAGIGLMPNYARAIGGDVEHVDLGFDFRVEIWLATHPEIAKSARHRTFIDFLTDSFRRTEISLVRSRHHDAAGDREAVFPRGSQILFRRVYGPLMSLPRLPRPAPEIVTLATQDEHDRIVMVLMQLEMALALAKAKKLGHLEAHLEAAIAEARSLQCKLLN